MKVKLLLVLICMLFTISDLYATDGYVKVTSSDNTISWKKIKLEYKYNGNEYKVSRNGIDKNIEGAIDLDNVWSESGGTGRQYRIIELDYSAFYDCSKITSVKCSSTSFVSIYDQAFENCSSLVSVSIPYAQSLGSAAFAYCNSLESVSLNRIYRIDGHAFYNCSALSSFNIPYGVRILEGNAFDGCTSLNNLTISENNAYFMIDNGVVYSKDLTTLEIYLPSKTGTTFYVPALVTSIGKYAFYGNKNLSTLIMRNGIQTIGNGAFENSNIQSVYIPSSVTSIGSQAFNGCSSLTSVISKIKEPFTIGSYVFNKISSNCVLTVPYGTRDAYIAAGWTEDVFKGGIVEASLINFTDANVKAICIENWDTDGDGELSEEEAAAVKDLGTVFTGTAITSFDELQYFTGLTSLSSFRKCYQLKSIVIPDGITYIPSEAFEFCSNLTSVSLSNSVTSLSNQAFKDCTSLVDISLPNSLTYIGKEAFQNCSNLNSIRIPAKVSSVGNSVFYNCSSLTSIISERETPFSFGSSMFYGIGSSCTLTVPSGTKDAYISAGWTEEIFRGGIREMVFNIPFADYQVKALCVANWDTNGDGELDEDELAAVSDIGIVFKENMNISSFDELQYFKGLTTINEYAFQWCFKLKSIIIPSNVTSIGYGVFRGCSDLISIIVAQGNTIYDSRNNCNAIIETSSNTLMAGCKNTTIPQNVTSIGDGAFYQCSKMTSISIPNSVTSIGSDAFRYCSGLTSMTIPYNVTSIGDYAFFSCQGLTSVTIPNSVTSIGDRAFDFCLNLTSINIPNSVKSIGNGAFYYCTSLTSVVISNCVTSIGNNTFYKCGNLTSINIPNSVTSIGDNAFSECSNLTSIKIPNGVTSIGDYSFADCSNLTSITIPSNVASIGRYAFKGCSSLASIIIPDGVTTIGAGTFSGCSSLTSINIPQGVTIIEGGSFYDCSYLKTITIPNSVTLIGGSAFSGCSRLTSVTIPNSVTKIWDQVFSGCSNLTSVVSKIEEPYAFEHDAFKNISSNCVLTVPYGKRDAYIDAGWTTSVFRGGIVEASPNITFEDSDVKYVCVNYWDTDNDGELSEKEAAAVTSLDYAFTENDDIVWFDELQYFKGLTSIGSSAFRNCYDLESISIPCNIKSIGALAFKECDDLKSLIIPNSVESIGDHAFDECYKMTSVIIPESLTSIGNYAFANCSSLTSITIPNSMTSIPNYAFLNCRNLSSIVIPDGITSIGSYAFSGCKGLESITIPNSLISIGTNAFGYCSGLTSVISEIEEPFVFGSNAFYGISSNCVLTVPYGTKDKYIAKGWTENIFKGGIIEADNLTSNNFLSIEDTEVCKGGSIALPVNMDNAESITALQFEISLPAGVTPSKCQLTDRKGEDHTTSYKKLANGNYQVTAFSGSKAVFSGTEGAVLSLTLDVNKDITEGDYPISITNIELTTVATKAINPVGVSATLTVSDVKVGDTDGNGRVSITDAVAVVSHILGEDIDGFVAAAADVDGNGRITITDAVAIVDMILDGTASAKTRSDMDEDMHEPQ